MLTSLLIPITVLLATALSQSVGNDTIWASVVYSYHGDRTPLVLPVQNVLTPLGAQQLFSSGSFFRQRYLAAPAGAQEANHSINGILHNSYDSSQTYIISTLQDYVVASAQAFCQGLYPPLNQSSGIDPASKLANGSIIPSPLGGYQYAQIYTTSRLDPNLIFIAGDVNCPRYDDSATNYSNSQQSLQTKSSTQDFYASLQPDILNGVFLDSDVDYDNAYPIYDYLSYGSTHNSTIKDKLSDQDLAKAHGLADQWVQAVNGNTSATTSIQTIAGQTMAAQVVALMMNNIENRGTAGKLNLLFGGFEPMIAFAALTQLPKANTDFNGMPNLGSSMVFELYSEGHNTISGYPSSSDLRVRFLFRNGTDSTAALNTYPLFGRRDTDILSFNEFAATLQNVALDSIGDWCSTCQSHSIFCAAFIGSDYNSDGGSHSFFASTKKVMKPTVAGVIGAVVALAVAGIVFAAAMLIGGVRLHRSKAKRRSELGGFKAGEKLASDQDLPRSQTGIGASVINKQDERVSSWELGERRRSKEIHSGGTGPDSIHRPSFETDDAGPHQSIEPTKVNEAV